MEGREEIKLDAEQKARAEELQSEMALTDDFGPYAHELIFLRDKVRKQAAFQKRVGEVDTMVRDAVKSK